MTNENYMAFTNQQLVEHIIQLNVPNNKLNHHIQIHVPWIYAELKKRTQFLDDDISIHARIYCIEHDLSDVPKCQNPECENSVAWKTNERKFQLYCCKRCMYQDQKRLEKMQTTCLLRYGCRNPFQSDSVKLKSRETCLLKYGVEYAIQSSIVENIRKQSNLNKYGVEYPSQLDEVKEKMKQTCIENYGVSCSLWNPLIHEKARLNSMEKYGETHPSKCELVKSRLKETNIKKYGCTCPLANDGVKTKSRQTNLMRYGVEHYAQSIEYYKNKKHKFHSEKYPGLTFDSTWEVKVYEFCRDNSIPIEYSPRISYPYKYAGRTWIYHPDFLINGKVYEVKGDNFFKIDESTSTEIMINPYRKPEWTDERYDWECGKYEAKHQCMIANNVIILRKEQIDNLDSVFNI